MLSSHSTCRAFIIPNPIPIRNLESRAHLIELLLGAKAIPGFTLVDDVYHAVESCGSKILDGAFTHMAPPLASNTGERTRTKLVDIPYLRKFKFDFYNSN